MATYNFSPDGALNAGSELEFVTNKIRDSLEELKQAVAAFQAANQGSTVENYSAAQSKWELGQREMDAAMVKGRVALDQIAHDYVFTDNRGAQVFGQLL